MSVDISEVVHEPVMTARPHQTVGHVRDLMTRHRVSALPVVNTEEEPIGMITSSDSAHDLLRLVEEHRFTANRARPPRRGRRDGPDPTPGGVMAIYDNIGGVSVIADAVEEFYGRLRADPILAGYFDDTDAARLETHQRMFITAVLGGPDAYEGRDMRAAHAHLPITDRDFDLFLDHLAATLADLGTNGDRISEVMDALRPLRVEIVSAAQAGPDEWGSQDPTGGGD